MGFVSILKGIVTLLNAAFSFLRERQLLEAGKAAQREEDFRDERQMELDFERIDRNPVLPKHEQLRRYNDNHRVPEIPRSE